MKLIKRIIDFLTNVNHPVCSYCGKVIEGISYRGMEVPQEDNTYSFSCGCHNNL